MPIVRISGVVARTKTTRTTRPTQIRKMTKRTMDFRAWPRAPGAGSDGPYGVHVVLDGAINVATVFRDNAISTTGGVPLLVVPQPALQPGLLFAGNTWDADAGPVTIAWGAITFDDVGAWTAATGQGP